MVVPLLSRLISFRTDNPGGDEPALAEFLAGELRAKNPDEVRVVQVPRDKNTGAYVLARWGEPRLLVNVHFDTVPVNAGWTGDPFVARVDEKRVTGLGAADTKGAIAAILCALESAKPKNTLIVFSGDEELTGTCIRAALPELTGVTHAIVCEPTLLQVGTRHRGILTLEADLRGEGGHSSRADQLPRPIAELSRLAVALDDWGRAHVGKGPRGFPGMCLNVAKLDGGIAFNVVPDAAHLTVSLRPPPGSDLASIQRELESLTTAKIEWSLENPSFETRDLASFAKWLNVEKPIDLMFWTEAAVLSEAGIDAVVIGPGDIAQAHGPDEWVDIEQLERAVKMFEQVFSAASRN